MSKTLSPELVAHLLNMYKIALVDNDYDPREQMCLLSIVQEYGLTAQEFEELLFSQENRDVQIPASVEERVRHLYDLARIAWADGIILDSERRMLRNFVIRYKFLEENADAIVEFLLSEVEQGTSAEAIVEQLDSL